MYFKGNFYICKYICPSFFLEKQGHHPPVPNILKPTIQTTSFKFSHIKHLQTITLQTNTQIKTSSLKTTTLQTTRGRKATRANSRRQRGKISLETPKPIAPPGYRRFRTWKPAPSPTRIRSLAWRVLDMSSAVISIGPKPLVLFMPHTSNVDLAFSGESARFRPQ
jgi:hypothetical protein